MIRCTSVFPLTVVNTNNFGLSQIRTRVRVGITVVDNNNESVLCFHEYGSYLFGSTRIILNVVNIGPQCQA